MGESGSAFNTRPNESENFNFGVSEDHLNSENPVATFSTSPPFTTTPPFNTATADGATTDGATDDDIDVGPVGLDFLKEEKTPSAPSEVAPSAPPLPTDFPASSSSPPTYHASSSITGTTKRGRGMGRGNTSPEKRSRVMGMGVFQAANGFKVMNASL
ncbi:hypothetical protein KY290_033286 [Solanum tuberosum]|uniref:Uncharacterized protein n=1 Tax=Solanum tuberosum TaxID=4113 RepID=A0ABQ7U1A9_SOLTU|nr:hypothetical protein KY289_032660 [Solanum tuberosum]KAH0647300.1 hypothetical protein KY285_032548 [Solanum tuberosum]KAH0740243.1 hypothetical protein KY290_033286 [Solanum tuberosum]